jgi:hypothetical protein
MKINKLFIVRDSGILARAISFVSTLIVDPKHPWCIYIGPESKLRTKAQNALLWAIYSEIADATGFDKDDLHEYFKKRLLGAEGKVIFGTQVEVRRSTTELDTIDFSDFVEGVIAIAAEQGIEIKVKYKQVVVG